MAVVHIGSNKKKKVDTTSPSPFCHASQQERIIGQHEYKKYVKPEFKDLHEVPIAAVWGFSHLRHCVQDLDMKMGQKNVLYAITGKTF